MHKRQIGTTDLWVNEIGYGTMNLAIQPNRPSEEEAIALLQRAVDEFGVEFLDTADSYSLGEDDIGYAERLIAKALRGHRRERVVVATKGGFVRPGGAWRPDCRPERLRATCEASLRALETDRIDLYQLHLADPNVPIADSIGALADLQREGKIRHIGVSNLSIPQMREAMDIAEIASAQTGLAFMYFNPNHVELLKFYEDNNITWIAFAPVGGHRSAHRMREFEEWMRAAIRSTDASIYSIAIAWLLRLSPRMLPIPATTKFDHLAENMSAADIQLSEEEVEAMKHPRAWMHDYMDARAQQDYPLAITALKKGLSFEERDPVTWYNLACVYSLSGDADSSIDALGRAASLGFPDANAAKDDDDLAAVKNDPRFEEVIGKMGR